MAFPPMTAAEHSLTQGWETQRDAAVLQKTSVYDLQVENFSKNKWITLALTLSDVCGADTAARL